jgi:hypothetical protein
MFERLVGDARRAALEAHSVAAGLGSSTVEAEHLLMSIASGTTPAAAALHEVGLEPQELRDAVQRDFERVLASVGIDASGIDVPAHCRRTRPRWGASAKQGLERALTAAAIAGSAASTSSAGCSAPSRAPSRACSRPRASTATS